MKYYYDDMFLSGYKIETLPLNKPIYGFAYDINDDTENKRLMCLPVLGEIYKNSRKNNHLYSQYCFSAYKKGTNNIRKSGAVDYNSRMYADTYEEAVEMFNRLVQKRINNLYRLIENAKSDMIKTEVDE